MQLKWQFDQLGIDTGNGPALEKVIGLQADRVKDVKRDGGYQPLFLPTSEDRV